MVLLEPGPDSRHQVAEPLRAAGRRQSIRVGGEPLDQGVDLFVDTGMELRPVPGGIPVRRRVAVEMDREMQGLEQVLGVVGEESGVYQGLAFRRLQPGPAAVFRQRQGQLLSPLGHGIGQEADLGGTDADLPAEPHEFVARRRQRPA